MNASTDVPLTITPEAAARIAELGMQIELEQMIAYIREKVRGLNAVEVGIEECYDTRDETGVRIEAYSDQVFEPEDTTSATLDEWVVKTFPPQVLEHLCVLLSPGRPYAG
jgi:hypothetical protein